MKLSLKLLVIAAAVSAAIVPVEALAQTANQASQANEANHAGAPYAERRIGDDAEVIFHDEDTLVGDAPAWYGSGLRGVPRVLRAGLIRPRTNFVPELLKSVENL